MLIVEVDNIGPEPFQRTLDALLDALGAAVLHLLSVLDLDPEFGGDHHLSAQWRQRLANELFVGVRTVNFGGIEECDAALDRKSTRLNSSHSQISYAVFCLKKKTQKKIETLASMPERDDVTA